MCLVTCDEDCPQGTACIAGICAPAPEPSVKVSIDPSSRYQTLVGFGASLNHEDDLIVGLPNKARLFDVMFVESGFDVVRIRNRYEPGNGPRLAAAGEIVSAATARRDRPVTIFLSGVSPPAALKANGNRLCGASDLDCTLIRNAGGNFDYASFAQHWRDSLTAYEQVGIHPDLVSIQSNADWVPMGEASEACHFLPNEGVGSVTTLDGRVLQAEFAGYAEAMEAVVASTSTLPAQYSFSGPEVGALGALGAYADALLRVQTLSYHVFDIDPAAVDIESFDAVRNLSDSSGKPSIQSAMQADGFGTAILAHYSLAVGNSAGYLQQHFVADTFDSTSTALIGATAETIEKLPAYHALSHFARFTEPGWVRVEANADSPSVLSSAWSAPDGSALTVVLVNPSDAAVSVELVLAPPASIRNATVVRTVFDGVERSQNLGRLAAQPIVRLPGKSILSVAASSD
jgi:O-glycosyl hydrolase